MKKAYYRRIPCFFNAETGDIKGRNFFYDALLDIIIWLDVHVFQVEGFPVFEEEERQNYN